MRRPALALTALLVVLPLAACDVSSDAQGGNLGDTAPGDSPPDTSPTAAPATCDAAPAALVTAVQEAFGDGQALQDTAAVTGGGLTYLGATVLDGSGVRGSAVQVWVAQDGSGTGLAALTDGATALTPDLPDGRGLGAVLGDPPSTAVVDCVAEAARPAG